MTNEKSNAETKVQIGKYIKQQFLQSKLSIEEFAGAIGCNRDNAYDIFRREHINTNQLLKISKILNYDFFKIYSELIDDEITAQMHITINIPRKEMEKGNICEYCEKGRNCLGIQTINQ